MYHYDILNWCASVILYQSGNTLVMANCGWILGHLPLTMLFILCSTTQIIGKVSFPQQRWQRWWRPWTWIKVYLFSYLREGEWTEEQTLCRLYWTLWLSAFIRSYNSLVYMNYTVSGDQILQSSWLHTEKCQFKLESLWFSTRSPV